MNITDILFVAFMLSVVGTLIVLAVILKRSSEKSANQKSKEEKK